MALNTKRLGSTAMTLSNYRQTDPMGPAPKQLLIPKSGYGALTPIGFGGPSGPNNQPQSYFQTQPVMRPFLPYRPVPRPPSRSTDRFYVPPPRRDTRNPWEVPTYPWESPPILRMPMRPSPPTLRLPDYPRNDWVYPTT